MKSIPLTANVESNEHWKAAVELWLASRNSEATRQAYAASMQDLLRESGRLPWEMTRTDVIRWVQSFKTRSLSPATVSSRLAGVASFYRFVCEDYLVEAADGSLAPLHTNNPASGKTLRPKIELYGRAVWLSPDEVRSLLRAIAGESVRARRNYALFLGYILLARRNSEWRAARWGDFERHGDQVMFRWSGKGSTDQRLEVPTPVWNALVEYLVSGGRFETIRTGEYLFTPLRGDILLPSGKTLAMTGPISSHEVGRILKGYCRAAGLDGKKVHPHSLRHTGAMLRREVGDSPEQIQKWLGHSNLAITAIYLHKLEGKADQSWARVADLLGLERAKAGAQNIGQRPKNRLKTDR